MSSFLNLLFVYIFPNYYPSFCFITSHNVKPHKNLYKANSTYHYPNESITKPKPVNSATVLRHLRCSKVTAEGRKGGLPGLVSGLPVSDSGCHPTFTDVNVKTCTEFSNLFQVTQSFYALIYFNQKGTEWRIKQSELFSPAKTFSRGRRKKGNKQTTGTGKIYI